MEGATAFPGDMEATLRHLYDLLGPHDDAEQVIVCLAYDVGMRLRAKLLAAVRAGLMSEEAVPRLQQGPFKDLGGRQIYELDFGGVRIQWAARRISAGPGRDMYI